MAKKKRKTTKRRSTSKALSSGRSTRRRSTRSRKTGLSEMFNPTVAANSAKGTLAAMAGGTAAGIINKMIPPTSGKLMRLGIAFGLGFVASAFNMPNTGAGFTGGMIVASFPNGFLNDDDDTTFADEDSLSDAPLFLDEDGSPMVLEEGQDGTAGYRYLSEDEIQMLEEQGAFDEYEEV